MTCTTNETTQRRPNCRLPFYRTGRIDCPDHVLHCKSCGFNQTEYERRRSLPLLQGSDGLYRKFVGTKTPKEEKTNEDNLHQR